MNPSKKAYIETFGCQMNERDSEIMGHMLANVDYSPTRDIKQADVIVINTCSIREKAEQKVYSLLGRIRKLKEEKPSLIISVAGCVARTLSGLLGQVRAAQGGGYRVALGPCVP